MKSKLVYGRANGKLVKAELHGITGSISYVVSKHQGWLKKQLGVESPVFGLIIGGKA